MAQTDIDVGREMYELGVKGAFASAGMDSSSDWRFNNQLAEIPVFYKCRDGGDQDPHLPFSANTCRISWIFGISI